jgi:hypothetical protein
MNPRNRLTIQPIALPDAFRPLFWSYAFEDLDPYRDERTIIIQLINYGTLAHWRWLAALYGVAEIKDVLESLPATEIKPRSRALSSVIFGITNWHDAPRGTR